MNIETAKQLLDKEFDLIFETNESFRTFMKNHESKDSLAKRLCERLGEFKLKHGDLKPDETKQVISFFAKSFAAQALDVKLKEMHRFNKEDQEKMMVDEFEGTGMIKD